jgi:antirestriction protein ArdC
LLLAQQCHARGITARRVAGFRTWLKLGRCVRKGEKGLMIFAPIAVTQRDEHGEPGDEKRIVFRSAFGFADTQTDPLPRWASAMSSSAGLAPRSSSTPRFSARVNGSSR